MFEMDFEAITKPNWDFSKFDLGLIGDDLSPGWEKTRSPLQTARLLAQVSGANSQEEVAQAVQGSYEEILRISKEFDRYYAPLTYTLFAWIALNIGHGDPGCANYHNWAGLVLSGNKDAFVKAKSKLFPHLERLSQVTQMPIHSELVKVLESPYRVHFTARRIPEVQYSDKDGEFRIVWPEKGLRETVGKAPTSIKL